MDGLAERLDADRRAVRRLQRLRQRYGAPDHVRRAHLDRLGAKRCQGPERRGGAGGGSYTRAAFEQQAHHARAQRDSGADDQNHRHTQRANRR